MLLLWYFRMISITAPLGLYRTTNIALLWLWLRDFHRFFVFLLLGKIFQVVYVFLKRKLRRDWIDICWPNASVLPIMWSWGIQTRAVGVGTTSASAANILRRPISALGCYMRTTLPVKINLRFFPSLIKLLRWWNLGNTIYRRAVRLISGPLVSSLELVLRGLLCKVYYFHYY